MNKKTDEMINEACKALANAYVPYSHFKVAACICTDKNNLYTGVNVENSSYGLTICAESAAICNMILSGEYHIKSIAVVAENHLLCAPCGACRQRIYEFSTPHTLVYLCNEQVTLQSLTIGQLLPLPFDLN